MLEEPQKPKRSLHFHVGGLVLAIILILVLFRVNMERAIDSPQFKSNIAYIEEKGEDFWNKYLSKPVLWIWNNLFLDIIGKSVEYTQGYKSKLQGPTTYEELFRTEHIKDNLGGMQGEKTSGDQ